MAAISLPEANAFGVNVGRTATSTSFGTSFTALEATSMETATATDTDAATAEEINPRLQGLAFALDDGTRKSHSMAQNSAFVQGFFKGISSPESYKNLLTSLYYVYEAMEVGTMDVVETAAAAAAAGKLDNMSSDSESESKSESESNSGEELSSKWNDDDAARWIAALDVQPLRRLKGLETDMEYFYGANWKTQMSPPTRGTAAYVARIQELSKKESQLYLFVAHQYTRYLGDLFGGQMMGSMASRSMDLPSDGSGTAFYTFDGVPSTKDFITEWYTTLNNLGVTPAQQQAIVDEANLVFDLNIGILEEVDGSPWQAVWTMVVSGAKEFTDWANIKESKNKNSESR